MFSFSGISDGAPRKMEGFGSSNFRGPSGSDRIYVSIALRSSFQFLASCFAGSSMADTSKCYPSLT